MPFIKIINDAGEIQVNNKFLPAEKFNSINRIVDERGNRVNSEYEGRRYRIIEKRERNFSSLERFGRGFLGVLAAICSLCFALLLKPVRELFTKSKENIRFAILDSATLSNKQLSDSSLKSNGETSVELNAESNVESNVEPNVSSKAGGESIDASKEEEAKNRAATKIQTHFRGYLARSACSQLKKERREALRVEEEERAARESRAEKEAEELLGLSGSSSALPVSELLESREEEGEELQPSFKRRVRPFDPNRYFSIITQVKNIKEPNFHLIQPNSCGLELIFHYLNDKYQTEIIHPINYYDITPFIPKSPISLQPVKQYIGFHSYSDIEAIKPYIEKAQKRPGDYRQGYIIADRGHAIFMAFIKEGNQSAILYSDSMGTNTHFTERISEKTGLKVFTHIDGRQADTHSCFIDGVVMGRDITAIDPKTGKYRLLNIIKLLESRVECRNEKLSLVRLPHELLKTAQHSRFIDHHRDRKDRRKIHKNESLAEFRERYTKTVLTNKGKKRISTYLQEKSVKYGEIIRIQYTINKIEKQTGSLPAELKKAFTLKAKKILRSGKGELHRFAEAFLNSYLPPPSLLTSNEAPAEFCVEASIKTEDERGKSPRALREDLHLKEQMGQKPSLFAKEEEIGKLAEKYNLLALKLEDEFNQIAEKMEKLAAKEEMEWEDFKIEKNLLPRLQEDEVFGLALTELLLLNPHYPFSTKFWSKLATTDLRYARLIINDKNLINKIARKKELYLFSYSDAYLAKEVVDKYSELLSNKEKKALTWISHHKMKI